MLFYTDGTEVKDVWHKKDYANAISRLSKEELAAIKERLNVTIEAARIHTSSWMPGNDWSGSEYQAIYEKAANRNEELAAKIFGLIVCDVMINREEKWYCHRGEKNGVPIKGMTYFLSQAEPKLTIPA